MMQRFCAIYDILKLIQPFHIAPPPFAHARRYPRDLQSGRQRSAMQSGAVAACPLLLGLTLRLPLPLAKEMYFMEAAPPQSLARAPK